MRLSFNNSVSLLGAFSFGDRSMSVENWWKVLTGEKEILGLDPVLLPLCRTLLWDRTQPPW
jgi:hypothetical protein